MRPSLLLPATPAMLSAAPTRAPQVECRKLSLRYGARQAVAGVELTLPARQITALIGPSGCGKSSLLTTLNRMVDFEGGATVSGDCCLDGESIYAPGVDVISLRRRVGMIFQQPNPFPLSIWRNLDLLLREHGVRDRHERAERIENALRQTGLWAEVSDRLQRSALTLSGGQQQRLCIARALVVEPAVLLMDEPCSALDPLSSERVEELILSLRDRYTVLVVTHNMAQARRIADQVGVMWLVDGVGQLIEVGPTEQIFAAPRHPLTAAYVQGRKG